LSDRVTKNVTMVFVTCKCDVLVA